jgi:hypothetical protein
MSLLFPQPDPLPKVCKCGGDVVPRRGWYGVVGGMRVETEKAQCERCKLVYARNLTSKATP